MGVKKLCLSRREQLSSHLWQAKGPWSHSICINVCVLMRAGHANDSLVTDPYPLSKCILQACAAGTEPLTRR